MVCTQPIAAGEDVLRIPLRLAITNADGANSTAAAAEGAERRPWSVELAERLLRLKQEGASSPWHPYLRVLPTAVPSPLATFTWEDVQAIEYQPMRRQLDAAGWLAGDAVATAAADAAADAAFSREQWEWALSVRSCRCCAFRYHHLTAWEDIANASSASHS